MNRVTRTKIRAWIFTAVCIAGFALQSCASVEPELVKQQDGYLYGYGRGSTLEEAELEAKRDLIGNALELSMRTRSGSSHRVLVNRETARGMALDAKRVAELEEEQAMQVTLRVSEDDWNVYEMERETAMRRELSPVLARISDSRPYAERARDAVAALSTLEIAGVDGLLTVGEDDDRLLFDAIADSLSAQSDAVSVSLSPEGGILSANPVVTVSLVDSTGAALEGVPLAAVWTYADDSFEETVVMRTDGDGDVRIQVPSGEDGVSRSVTLRVTAALSADAKEDARRTGARLSSMDGRISAEATYVIGESLANRFGSFVRIEAGPFEMGAVPGDKRAPKREAARTVETGMYDIAARPVTNAQYRLFLDATGYEKVPEFLDNPDYTLPDQPVVGVTRADVDAFTTWLSGVLETTVRLPTEAEWEKAAKAGQNVAFPWGNDDPADGIRANFRGNGKYNRPSPVGSFPEGANSWEMDDMAGNVWELVQLLPEQPQIAKGGSWMEGPNDVRISNRREINPAKTYADVGFRVVMEVMK